MREFKRRILLSSLFFSSLIPLIVLFVFWSQLPSSIPAHWSGDVADRWGSKVEMIVPALLSTAGAMAMFACAVRIAREEQREEDLGSPSIRNTRKEFIRMYASGLLISFVGSIFMTIWIQLALAGDSAISERTSFSVLYALPGVAIACAALFPGQGNVRNAALCRVAAVAFGLCEAVLCGFVLEGASAAYLMITLSTLLSLVETGIYISRQ